MTLGLVGALVAAVAYGAGTVLQAIGARRLTALPSGAGGRARVGAALPYAAGLGLDGLGFAASVLALRTLPLFLVESAVASSVAVTAVLSVVVLHLHLRRAEIGALGAVAVGLVCLAAVAEPGPAVQPGNGFAIATLVAAAAVAALLATGALDHDRQRGAIVLSVAAGLGFGGVGVSARLIEVPDPWWHLGVDALAWALVAHAALATVAYGLALARARVTTVAAITFVTETVVPATIGLALLGDRVLPGRWPLAGLAFALTLVGCIVLAGRSESSPSRDLEHDRDDAHLTPGALDVPVTNPRP
ncbi:hypothetical protein BA895_18920 [Humibacillus sp. DSM 29435]|uniref:hypothetical protein n=1 Tax=Humibacillus sp. DSM 29435 TaxID=1869167 RepID=UPI000872DDEF|nr:hypothetical protein [Humibacillus sp. DSM 29435]OFE16400.1 hypothetical protein BA895_18920 [Humibacillus sp. DSM 29435]